MQSCSLRRNVSKQQDDVWSLRNDIDLYTLQSRSSITKQIPEIDHMLEIMLFERAFERARHINGANCANGFAVAHATELLRDQCNMLANLNVTTRRINQKKKGPIGSAMRRQERALGAHDLRIIPLEQYARSGAARELVDSGVWKRIERSIQSQLDQFDTWIENLHIDPELETRMHRSTTHLLNTTCHNLVDIVEHFRLED